MLLHVLACLRGPTAAGRQLGAFITTHWAQEARGGSAMQQPGGGVGAAPALPPDLQQLLPVLLELLAAPAAQQAPYTELAQLYAQLRSQAGEVVARGVAAGVPLALGQPLQALGVEGALALVAQIPAGASESRVPPPLHCGVALAAAWRLAEQPWGALVAAVHA